jgi:hypothetical protein
MSRITLSSLLAGACLVAAFGLSLPRPATAADAPATAAPPAVPAAAQPAKDPREPSRIPVSWELTIKHGTLERVTVPLAGKDQTFWFMRYSVINNSGRDILFTPSFEILAETGTAVTALKAVPAPVFDKIKSLYNNPYLLSPTNIDGKLLQGDDNAKDGVAIFPTLDSEARNFQLFFMGLSGETSEVLNPLTKKPVILQKTLELDFNLPGQAIGIDPQPKLLATKWVMK